MHENFLKEKLKCKMIYSNLANSGIMTSKTIVENLKDFPDFSVHIETGKV
jgi:hypothetical protein